MSLKFHKMHGLGNDFILIDNRSQNFKPETNLIQCMADRHKGIGCDQLLLLNPPEQDDSYLNFRIFNADGSEAEQCGNGMRCIALYLAISGELNDNCLQIAGLAGPVEICWQPHISKAKINMGQPVFAPEQIPLDTNKVVAVDDFLWQLDLADTQLQFYAVSIGNPHIIILAEDYPGKTLEFLAQKLTEHPAFPAGVNIGLVESYSREQIVLQVHERGSGQTQACGSGACAAMAVLRQAGKVEQLVTVIQGGGKLDIEWPAEKLMLAQTGRSSNNDLWMSGPAAYIFQGETDDS